MFNLKRLKTGVILGEDTRDAVAKNKGVKLFVRSCIWCDKEVWISEFGFTEDNPVSDISITELPKDIKALHKLCLLEVMDMGFSVYKALESNLKVRGEL